MYHFIVNLHSRTGRAPKYWERMKAELNHRNIPYKEYLTQYSGHATKLADSICSSWEGVKKIIIVGGDGTANEVINGLSGYPDILLGYIPIGSSNDLAQGLGLPKNPMTALEHIISPKRYQFVDHGIITYYDGSAPMRFGVSAGIGYDADVCYEAQTSRLKRFLNHFGLGKLTYIMIAVKQIITNRPVDVEVLIDGTQKRFFKKTVFLAAMIQKYEGGGLPMAPSADNSDGKLTVCAVSNMSKLKIFLVMPSIFFGRHIGLKGVELLTCTTMEVKASESMVLHADGEFGGKKEHVRFSCLPEQIRMYL